VKWVGYDSDASAAAPKAYLTAAVYDWGPYYVSRVKAAMDGTWKTGSYYGSLADGFVQLAPFGPDVSPATQSAIQAEMAKLKATPQAEFTGPIADQGGAQKIGAGQQASLGDLLSITWLVKGIQGSPTG
jgi:basic membrane protein A